jgi:hypothetical protein
MLGDAGKFVPLQHCSAKPVSGTTCRGPRYKRPLHFSSKAAGDREFESHSPLKEGSRCKSTQRAIRHLG